MRSTLFNLFKVTLLAQVIFLTQVYAQLDKEYPSKIKFRHLMGVVNHESEQDIRNVLKIEAILLQMCSKFEKMKIVDSLSIQLSDTSIRMQRQYLNFTNGLTWELPDGIPKYPDLKKRMRSKDYEFEEDPEAVNWLFYAQIVEYWKENKKLPKDLIHSFSCIDTLEFSNNTSYHFLLERKFKNDSARYTTTELLPLK